MKYKAAIFDLDGTLLDTLEDIGDSMNRALTDMGYGTHTMDEYKMFVGDGIALLAQRSLPAGSGAELIKKTVDLFRSVYFENCMNKTRPYPNIPETLDKLKAAGMTISVLSNKSDDLTKYMVEKLFPGFEFNTVMGASGKFKNKPDTTAALHLAELSKIVPEEHIFIGDSTNDMLCASEAGMFPIGVSWGFKSVDELIRSGARAIVSDPLEIVTIALSL